MKSHSFHIVDVFAEAKYSGNQLAVVQDAGAISSSEMQRIAKEMNYSETTFILSGEQRDGGYDVRIFTPEEELPFAGHPTLGTAYVIQQAIIGELVDRIILNLKVGRIPVTFHYRNREADVLWMQQKPPTFGAQVDGGTIASALHIDKADIDDRYPVEEVSTGVPFIIVPLRTLDALKAAHVAREEYFKLIKDMSAKMVLIFCPHTRQAENHLSVRVFADHYGVAEDPATGSANGCLASYLVKHEYLGEQRIDIRVEQGHEIGRPSLLLLRAEQQEREIDVFVGGRVIMTAKGELV
jgi:trans-2,3-dihydro-3-hydroxyanthranilate isomerase